MIRLDGEVLSVELMDLLSLYIGFGSLHTNSRGVLRHAGFAKFPGAAKQRPMSHGVRTAAWEELCATCVAPLGPARAPPPVPGARAPKPPKTLVPPAPPTGPIALGAGGTN